MRVGKEREVGGEGQERAGEKGAGKGEGKTLRICSPGKIS